MAGLDSRLGKIASFLTWSMMIVVINDMTASVCFGAVQPRPMGKGFMGKPSLTQTAGS